MTKGPQPLALAPLMADQLARFLDSERATRDRAANTITAYQADLLTFLAFLGGYHGTPALPATLGQLTQSDMRAFAASERARGLSARSLARRMSAVRSFIRWISDRHGFDASKALAARSPGSSGRCRVPGRRSGARSAGNDGAVPSRRVDRRA